MYLTVLRKSQKCVLIRYMHFTAKVLLYQATTTHYISMLWSIRYSNYWKYIYLGYYVSQVEIIMKTCHILIVIRVTVTVLVCLSTRQHACITVSNFSFFVSYFSLLLTFDTLSQLHYVIKHTNKLRKLLESILDTKS